MDIIKAGIGISKAFRNITRLREIVSIFAKNGFEEFISIGVTSKIPNFVLPKSKIKIKQELDSTSKVSWQGIIGLRLRKCFEELGPAFIKIGQLLGSREDLFNEDFINEMHKLRDKVKGVEFSEVKRTIEQSLGSPLEKVFSNFNEEAIGTASIGVVYKACLLDGTDVVVKVRRPNIEKIIEIDFSIMLFLIGQIERASNEIKYLGISKVMNDFSLSLQNELNFHVEALNCNRFNENLSKRDEKDIFYIPKIYKEYTRDNILVMEHLDGIPFSDTKKILEHKKELEEKLTLGLAFFMRSFLEDGFFHADLHGGNFFFLKNGKIGLIDYGLMGSLSRKSRQNLVAIIYALLTFNYENLVYEFIDVAEYDTVPDIEDLIRDVRSTLSPYVGLTVQQTNYSEVFQSIMLTLNKHRMFLPRDWFLVFRALMTLDGVGRTIEMDFDLFNILQDDIKSILKGTINKDDIIEEAVWATRDMLPILRILPRHLKWFIKQWSKDQYSFKLVNTGYEKELLKINYSIGFLARSILAGVFLFVGAFMLETKKFNFWMNVPIPVWVCWFFSFVLLIRVFFPKKKKF